MNNLTIIDITGVWNTIINTLNQVYTLLFDTIEIKLGTYQVPIGDIFITIFLIAILLRIVLTIRTNNIDTITQATERRLRK